MQDYLLVFYLERGLYTEAYSLTREVRDTAKWKRLRNNLMQPTDPDDRRNKKV